MLSEQQARFLASLKVGHLATADARAAPHLVPVCFVVSEGVLYITIDQKPKGDVSALKRLRNIIENPVAAFVADRWDEDWTRLGWVMLRGPAEILADGTEHDRAQALLRSRYPQYQGMELDALPVIAIRIERVTSWGNLSAE
jgi:PPOX class probable F420-dependent enzyme